MLIKSAVQITRVIIISGCVQSKYNSDFIICHLKRGKFKLCNKLNFLSELELFMILRWFPGFLMISKYFRNTLLCHIYEWNETFFVLKLLWVMKWDFLLCQKLLPIKEKHNKRKFSFTLREFRGSSIKRLPFVICPDILGRKKCKLGI